MWYLPWERDEKILRAGDEIITQALGLLRTGSCSLANSSPPEKRNGGFYAVKGKYPAGTGRNCRCYPHRQRAVAGEITLAPRPRCKVTTPSGRPFPTDHGMRRNRVQGAHRPSGRRRLFRSQRGPLYRSPTNQGQRGGQSGLDPVGRLTPFASGNPQPDPNKLGIVQDNILFEVNIGGEESKAAAPRIAAPWSRGRGNMPHVRLRD